MSKLLLVILLTSLALAPSADAARLEVIASEDTIQPGDLLTVSVLGDSDGEVGNALSALLVFEGISRPSDAMGPFVLNTTGGESGIAEWGPRFPDRYGKCETPEDPLGTCRAAEAVFIPFIDPAIDLLPSTLSVFEFETSDLIPGGVIRFQAEPREPSLFFSAGPSEIVTVRVIPEPGTAVLVALGLVFLTGNLGSQPARKAAG